MCSYFEQYARSEGLNPFSEIDAKAVGNGHRRIRPTDLAWTVDSSGICERSWSLIPSWSDSARPKFATFNARAETVRQKPSFRDAWQRHQRCLIPVTAWFEWPQRQGRKQLHRVQPRSGGPIWIAGLWNDWTKGGETRASFTMITTVAREDLQPLHPRMPLILDEKHFASWLEASPDAAGTLLSWQTELALEWAPESNQADLFA